jgi:hypothetical protein
MAGRRGRRAGPNVRAVPWVAPPRATAVQAACRAPRGRARDRDARCPCPCRPSPGREDHPASCPEGRSRRGPREDRSPPGRNDHANPAGPCRRPFPCREVRRGRNRAARRAGRVGPSRCLCSCHRRRRASIDHSRPSGCPSRGSRQSRAIGRAGRHANYLSRRPGRGPSHPRAGRTSGQRRSPVLPLQVSSLLPPLSGPNHRTTFARRVVPPSFCFVPENPPLPPRLGPVFPSDCPWTSACWRKGIAGPINIR